MGSSIAASAECVLALGAHPDDFEHGRGGPRFKFREDGTQFHDAILAKSGDETSEDSHLLPVDYQFAAREIGVTTPLVFDIPYRTVPEHGTPRWGPAGGSH